jgi:hypothetical protein
MITDEIKEGDRFVCVVENFQANPGDILKASDSQPNQNDKWFHAKIIQGRESGHVNSFHRASFDRIPATPAPIQITEADVGRYVRHVAQRSVHRIDRDILLWQNEVNRADYEFVTITPADQPPPEDKALAWLKAQIEEKVAQDPKTLASCEWTALQEWTRMLREVYGKAHKVVVTHVYDDVEGVG